MDQAGNRADILRPYLPRLLISWLADDAGTPFQELEGTLAFVDISGFTKLSERLARKGKFGAEELSTLLGSVFNRLLAEAYGNEGSLVKFGGDALLLFFSGTHHEARAARTAVGMRATLRQIGSLETSAGTVTLRMSIGLHSGTFHFFLVGTSHRELILTGPAATTAVLAERAATAGEILVSEGTAAALPESVLGAERWPGRLLRREPPGLSPASADTEVPAIGVDLTQAVPLAIREHLLGGGGGPEHRRVSVAFLQFQGTDALLELSGPEVVAQAINDLVTEVQRVVDEHQLTFLGTDIDADGGKIILTAGAPKGTGNDEERMLRALREIIEAKQHFSLRIGVNRGDVFAGDIGPSYRRTFTVMGDGVNLAARLMAKAEAGQIVATTDILKRSPTAFETSELEPFLVKGKKLPIQAFSVGAVIRGRATEAVALGPLVGRDQELKALLLALEGAQQGDGRLFELVGEPGIGKSRLMLELRTRAPHFEVLYTAGQEYEASTPYFPFRGLLRRVMGISDDGNGGQRLAELVEQVAPQLRPWLPLIAIPVGVEVNSTLESEQLEEKYRRPRLHEALGELLTVLLPGPTLFTFEDVHWMDEPSADFLRHLAHKLAELPWLVGVTRRQADAGFVAPDLPNQVSIHLEPLTAEDADSLAWALTDEVPLAQHQITALAQRSGGNPLFLKELVAAARTAESVDALPDSVEAVITARIDQLAPIDRTVLRRASVLGGSFTAQLLAAVLPDELAYPGEEPWLRVADFVHRDGDGLLHFRDALIRDVAYEGLPYRQRQELHARVGEAIERSVGEEAADQAEVLSLHFFRAQRFEKAWRYAVDAGKRAETKFANVEAAEFYERALGAAARIEGFPVAELRKIHEALGDARHRLGLYAEAAKAFRASRRLSAAGSIAEAELLFKEGWMRERMGRYTDALRWHRRGIKTLETIDAPEAAAGRAKHMAGYGAIRQEQGRYRQAIEWCLRAVAEATRGGEKRALAQAYLNLAWAHAELGRSPDAPYSEMALAIYEELGDLGGQSTVLNNLGAFAYYEGRWDEARDLYERGRVARQRIGDAVVAAFGTNNVAEILSDQGDLAKAEELFREARRVWRAAGFQAGVAYATSNLGRVAYRSGKTEEALTLLKEARERFEAIGMQSEIVETDARIAECLLLQAAGEEALALASETVHRAESLGGVSVHAPVLHRIRGSALMQTGRLEEARQALEESLKVGLSRRADYEVALTMSAMAELSELRGDPPDPGFELERLEILKRLGVDFVPRVPIPRTDGEVPA